MRNRKRVESFINSQPLLLFYGCKDQTVIGKGTLALCDVVRIKVMLTLFVMLNSLFTMLILCQISVLVLVDRFVD